ncbi:FH2 domain-containing protein 1 [Chanos chanos]|uniref:FH2 domain-containing protein 1 n=1 Tax=Chanos chanos TaxID=29144 RepID=A0A6J2WKC7_CHACN|nr:FH2 domain-containing protein 1 [Chanos chanos]
MTSLSPAVDPANGSMGSTPEHPMVPNVCATSQHDPQPAPEPDLDPDPSPGPPLVPPPPPPPPPPPLQGPSLPGAPHNSRKKRRVRSFFWKTIPEEKVRGKPNIWTLAVRQHQYQIDVRTVEELFGQQDDVRNQAASGTQSRPGRTRRSFKENKDEISILDSKRGMNVGIFLKQFKKPNQAIVEDIRQGNGKLYGSEPLKELLKLLPEEEEVKRLREFKGDSSKLTLVDSFMYLLIQVPRYEVRIEAMVLQEEFFPLCAVMSREISVVHSATEELMTCEELHAILHLVLQAGNIMNAGGYAGNAVGFKLSSLLSLADTKANKPGMNLLHFVALEAQKKDESLLRFPEKLSHVQSAARISVENIEADFSSLYVRSKSLEEKIQGDSELLEQLGDFLQSSAQTLLDLKRRRLDLRKEGNALIDFFCEDKDTFKLDECFRIFQDFCLKFKKAVKDNADRELKEAARQRRLQELEERRSAWAAAGGDQGGGGGFGRSSSENDVDTLTKDGLLDFLLQTRPHSPHSPVGRSASARRHRHTTGDRNLRGFIELFGGSGTPDYAKFSSLPRSSRPLQRKTMAWLVSQDDNRELEPQTQLQQERVATSPKAETEPISPLARYSTSGYNVNDDLSNNNSYACVSEGAQTPRFGNTRNVFQKTPGQGLGHLNVNVERHMLVPGLPPFELPGPNSKTGRVHVDNEGDVFVTDLEQKRDRPRTLLLDTPPSSKGSEEAPKPMAAWGADDKLAFPQHEEEEDASTVSSTTCDTPLPLDTSVSSKKPVCYILDCTETDCSVMLDCSEIESSPVAREGPVCEPKVSDSNVQGTILPDPSSLSSHLESMSTNDLTVSTSTEEHLVPKPAEERPESVTPSITTDEADTDSCDTAEGRRVDEKAVQTSNPKLAHSKAKTQPKTTATRTGRTARTLTSTESHNMRKVVPITKLSRSNSNAKKAERPSGQESTEPRRPLRDQSTPARRGERQTRPPRHSSLPPEEPKAQRGTTFGSGFSHWMRDTTSRKPSFRKPNAKPIRNIPKPAHEEKMCRSTMRALAQAQAQAAAEGSAPQTPTHGVKLQSPVPSFARNTVASSSRTKKDPPLQPSPSTPSKSSTLSRTGSQKQPSGRADTLGVGHLPRGEEKPQGSLRRVQSVRVSSRNTQRGDTPPPPRRERSRKSSSFSEKSIQLRDSISSRSIKPSWK